MKTRTVSATAVSLLLSVFVVLVMIVCLQIGGFVSIIAMSIWLLIFIFIVILLINTAINPKSKSMNVGIKVGENGKKRPNPTAWDEHMIDYENRWKSLAFWISILIQLTWVAAFLHYGYLYAVTIYIISGALAEAVRWRVYKCIRENKLGWGVAGLISEIRDFMEGISKETKSANEEE